MSICCPVWSDPDPPTINPALALPACRAVGRGLTAARKWGLSLIFRQDNRGGPHFLSFFLFQVFGGATALPGLLSPLPHTVHPPLFSGAEAKQKRSTSETAPLLHRCTSEALAVHWRNQAKLTGIYAKRTGAPPECRVVCFVCVVCVALVVPGRRLDPYYGDRPPRGKTDPPFISVYISCLTATGYKSSLR